MKIATASHTTPDSRQLVTGALHRGALHAGKAFEVYVNDSLRALLGNEGGLE